MKHTILVAVVVALVMSAGAGWATRYQITDLNPASHDPWDPPRPPGYPGFPPPPPYPTSQMSSGACGINDHCQIAGYTAKPDSYPMTGGATAAVWRNGAWQAVGATSGRSDSGLAMGEPSDATGFVMVGRSGLYPTLWNSAGGLVLQGPDGSYYGSAESINATGDVAGYIASQYANPSLGLNVGDNVCLWSGGDCIVLGRGRAHAVNDSRTVVGDYNSRAFSWDLLNGIPRAHTLSSLTSSARGINTAGDIVGYSINADRLEACIWSGYTTRWLGVLPGFSISYGYAINDSKQVAGYCTDASRHAQAFAWDGTEMVALDGLVPGGESKALGINSQGWIVGTAVASNGLEHAVLWTPVPEPSSLLALAFGLVGIGRMMRRRRG